MKLALWIVQGLLALMFLMAGFQKATLPINELLNNGISWVDRFPLSMVRFIGIVELLGAIGLILPWLFKIWRILTPLAATGLVAIMTLAIFHHLQHGEGKAIAFNSVLLLLAAFVAFGRFRELNRHKSVPLSPN